MTKEEKLAIIELYADDLTTELMNSYVIEAEPLPGVAKEDQIMLKICILTASCHAICLATKEMATKLGSALTKPSKPVKLEEDLPTEEEKKEWN